jgi:hypothetical protein
MLPSSPLLHALAKDIMFLPKTKYVLFHSGEICLATHFLKHELAPFEQDNHLSSFTLTNAMGGDIGVICQSQMNDAAFVRQHRLQGYGATSESYLVCQIQSQFSQILTMPLLISSNVDRQWQPSFESPCHYEPNDIL